MKRSSFLKSAAIAGAGAAAAGSGLSLLEPAAEAFASPARKATSLSGLRMVTIVKTVNSDYWQIVLAAAKKAAKDYGVQGLKYTGADAESNIAGQVNLLENAITQKPDFIVFSPTDKTALDATIAKAFNAGIKVILIDSAATTTKYQSFLSTDNHAGGMACADALAASIKAKTGSASGPVAYATFQSNVGSLGQRDQGFLDGLKKYPGLKLVAHKDAGGDQTTKAVSIAADTITANPNLVGYFADNLYTLVGAVTAFGEKHVNNKKVSLVGFDSNTQLVNDLAAGTVDGLLLQDPYMMGYGGVGYGILSALGVKTPVFLDTGATVATKANMNSPLIKGLLLPLGKPGRMLGL
ncbi:MAG: periplasmic ribose-binding protein sugar transporter [Chloroflexi bacterium]|nr:periplasmic ribose-binding protein sugar transporter [Chloroflexota bacterium]MDB5077607.1 periplasmic ribose-binding protein sugar transporter [Chloroflexota bacterium]